MNIYLKVVGKIQISRANHGNFSTTFKLVQKKKWFAAVETEINLKVNIFYIHSQLKSWSLLSVHANAKTQSTNRMCHSKDEYIRLTDLMPSLLVTLYLLISVNVITSKISDWGGKRNTMQIIDDAPCIHDILVDYFNFI